MIGRIEAPKAWWMAQGMARTSGVPLPKAALEGWLTHEDLAQIVLRCQSCTHCTECQSWLAQPGNTTPPDFCVIGPDISALARHAPR